MRAFAIVATCLAFVLSAHTGHAAELLPYKKDAFEKQLQLSDLAGRSHQLEDYRGNVVLINFWASWCAPCLAEMPSMLRLEKAMQGRSFKILAINFKESKSTVWKFYKMLGLNFVTLLDVKGEVSSDWGVELLPTSFLVDADGNIRYRLRGSLDWDTAATRSLIESILPQGAAHSLETAAVQLKP